MADLQTSTTTPPKGRRRHNARTKRTTASPEEAQQAHLYATEQMNQRTDGFTQQQTGGSSTMHFPQPSQLGDWYQGYTGSPYDSQGYSGLSSAPDGEGNVAHNSTRRKKSRSHHVNAENNHWHPSGPGYLDGTVPSGSSPQPRNHTNNPSNSSRKVSATPSKQAYAGPTFHASPAASSLPIPKLFSKSLPATSEIQARLDESEEVSPSPATPDLNQREVERSERESTPLDIFFNAHRAEQARKTSASLAASSHEVSDSAGSNYLQTPPVRPNISHTKSASRISSSGKEVFMMELEDGNDMGTEDESVGPTRSFNQRIQEMRNSPAPQAPALTNAYESMDENERRAKSEALKRLLMPPSSQPVAELPDSTTQRPITAPAAHPSEPARKHEYNVRSMENDLRKILKIDATEVDST